MTLSRRRLIQAALVLPPALAARAEPPRTSGPQVFADFENGWGDWTTEGDAFGLSPADDTLFPGAITGFGGRGFVCTLHPRRGVAATGRAVSPAFVIAKPFISFKIGGGNFPHSGAATVGEATLNLVVAGQVVRTATGDGTPHLSLATWNVADLAGRQAHFEIIDSTRSDKRGYILVDDIVFDDRRNTDFQKVARCDRRRVCGAQPLSWRVAVGLPQGRGNRRGRLRVLRLRPPNPGEPVRCDLGWRRYQSPWWRPCLPERSRWVWSRMTALWAKSPAPPICPPRSGALPPRS